VKILLVNKFFFLKGGAESCFFDTAKLLRDKGHEVVFFSMAHPDNSACPYYEYFVSEVDFERASSFTDKIKASGRLLYSFEARKKLEQLIRREKPDVAHLHNIHHQISPSILHCLEQFDLPVVMTIHDYKLVCPTYTMFNDGRVCERCKGGQYYQCFLARCCKNSRLKSLLNTIGMYLHHSVLRIYGLVDIFISPSRFLKDKLGEMGFGGKMVYLPNFVDVDGVAPSYSWDDNSITYFGRLSAEKGLFTLISAVRGLGLKCTIIGEGPIREDLERKVREESAANVVLSGYRAREQLRKEVGGSMFVVLPSEWYENSPRSVAEAFALGKPVIGSRIGGIPELVRDGQTGLTFEPGNSSDLRAKIEGLSANSKRIMELGQKAREFVEHELSRESHYQQLMKIYELATDEHG